MSGHNINLAWVSVVHEEESFVFQLSAVLGFRLDGTARRITAKTKDQVATAVLSCGVEVPLNAADYKSICGKMGLGGE